MRPFRKPPATSQVHASLRLPRAAGGAPRSARFQTYQSALLERNAVLHVHDDGAEPGGSGSLPAVEQALPHWIRSLPGPVAVFCHQDRVAVFACQLFLEYGVKVPEEVAILGVDNQYDLCTSITPHLSSIALPWEKMGEMGAIAMQRMLSGPVEQTTLRVPPVRVVERD
jgi:LacI family transcriptional regulator